MLFSSSFKCCYLTIDLVRSPIVGCEGTGAGCLYSHRRQLVETLQNLSLRDQIVYQRQHRKGHRGIMIFCIRWTLLNHPYVRGTWPLIVRQQERLPQRCECAKCVHFSYLVLQLGFLSFIFILPYTLITNILHKIKSVER